MFTQATRYLSRDSGERATGDTADGYTIRQYRDGDRDDVLALYQDVLNADLSSAWFEWKYETNPSVADVPVYVAATDGEVVGAGGFWVLELQTGSRSIPVVQPCDAAVRPDHRRQGLYTEIMGMGLDRFEADGFEVAFDFPNELSQATFETYGWRPVERREEYVRVQRPAGLTGTLPDPIASLLETESPTTGSDSPVPVPVRQAGSTVLETGSALLARGYLAATSVRRPSTPDAIEVASHETVPVETLASLYRRDVPDAFHVVRDETFYEWRFENPQWEYTTYVARYEGTPIAAVVRATQSGDGATIARLTDLVPLVSNRARLAGFVQILEAILEESRDAAIVVAPTGTVPRSVLAAYGFRSDRSFPLSLGSMATVHGVCSLTDDGAGDRWIVDGKRLSDPDAWQITFSEYDTG